MRCAQLFVWLVLKDTKRKPDEELLLSLNTRHSHLVQAVFCPKGVDKSAPAPLSHTFRPSRDEPGLPGRQDGGAASVPEAAQHQRGQQLHLRLFGPGVADLGSGHAEGATAAADEDRGHEKSGETRGELRLCARWHQPAEQGQQDLRFHQRGI